MRSDSQIRIVESVILSDMEHAHAQYDDALGTAAADWHDGGKLHELATAAGIDTTKYFPVGISLFGTELGITEIFAVDLENIHVRTFEGVRDFIANHREEVKGVSFPVPEEVHSAVGAYLKRLEVVLSSKGLALEGIDFPEHAV